MYRVYLYKLFVVFERKFISWDYQVGILSIF